MDHAARWVTLDCYGTLVDWEAGIAGVLGRLFGTERSHVLLARYHALEPAVQGEDPSLSYREVMARVLERLSSEVDSPLDGADRDALGDSLPAWPVFPDVPAGLAAARRSGWRLAILSNSDPELIAASIAAIGVSIDLTVVASEIGSYKPAPGHWEAFFARTGADRTRHVHVAASVFHDVAPALELGLRTVWVNRGNERSDVRPMRELADLSGLPQALAEIG